MQINEIPEFVNREKELKEFKALLSGRPNLVYFVYGPINSGKTALLMKVFEELPENYCVFYINFRGLEGGYAKLMRAFFRLGDESLWKKIKGKASIIAGAIEYVEKVARKFNTKIELPGEVIRLLSVGGEDPEKIDVFDYLEGLMRRLKETGKTPVLIIDEMQVIKDELNATGKPVLSRLFNFLVRLTKETHLCHCLCATSDCLFIEDIYNNARLEGRARYILVDDLSKEEAFKVYEEFGFENKELIWEYIGGKFGDMIRLYEDKKRGLSEEESLNEMLKSEKRRLEWIRLKKLRKRSDGKEIWEFLLNFRDSLEIEKAGAEEDFEKLLFWIEENVLFYNPLDGTVRPQTRLLYKVLTSI